ncbi:hypothetical protein R1T40_08650 [Tritonibacter scottomollicae]|uniref:Uncharacterized protein n=1 Tax=Tritonibacter scottomollicae TaxID=483013 RepID=A0ABZ0HIV6_TRISK|nr:hypothetical protein [Tritonibacter scottomollicae]WOI34780.1 hypothetical protein R1T40_08650 [Tritonibacter scottomollicae]
MLTLKHNGKTFANWSADELRNAGVPSEVIVSAKQGVRRRAVSAECRRRIYAAASAEAQMNMATAAAITSAKAEVDRTDDDKTVLDGVHLALAWVADMRAAFEALAADPDADFMSDAAWPALPPEIPPLIDRF